MEQNELFKYGTYSMNVINDKIRSLITEKENIIESFNQKIQSIDQNISDFINKAKTSKKSKIVSIFWSEYSYKNNDALDINHNLYVIIKYNKKEGKNVPVYIGQSYWATIRDRLHKHKKDKFDPDKDSVFIGKINTKMSDSKKNTTLLINYLENLLIFEHEPEFNKKLKTTYYGSEHLIILNFGCDAIKPYIIAKEYF